ncbi:MAG: fibronectin type III domain-containing protein [Fimbriimonadaceae bacterium]
MKNDLNNLSVNQLRTLATQFAGVAGLSPSTYGATAAQITSLTTANTTLGGTAASLENAKEVYHGWVQQQAAEKAALLAQVRTLANQAYNKPGITGQQLQNAGLAVHDAKKTPIIPMAPTALTTQPHVNGTVELKWVSSNPYGVTYFVEASIDGGDWIQVFATKRKSIMLQGFTPGVTTSFRVKASNRGVVTVASPESVIYPAGASNAMLRLAA